MTRPRPREFGISPGVLPPGPENAISDVRGVGVGHVTVDFGEGDLEPGKGPARTGVTAVMPHAGDLFNTRVTASALVINGFGKPAGLAQVEELGELETPVLLTSTMSVPQVSDACLDYMLSENADIGVSLSSLNPVVLECNDGRLNDMRGRHVKAHHVARALDLARRHSVEGGPVEGGAVGAGRGMLCYQLKGGIGTSSRRAEEFTVGSLVLANFGRKEELRIDGLPVGRVLKGGETPQDDPPQGSVILLLATDAPLSSRQLRRLCIRAAFGLARTGTTCAHGSGDFALAFSTSQPKITGKRHLRSSLTDPALNRLFGCAVEATEEAIYDALFRAETVVGRDGNRGEALPLDPVARLMEQTGYPWEPRKRSS